MAIACASFAIFLTWPLVLDLESRIYGVVGDSAGAIAVYRELTENGIFPFAPGTFTDFNGPDGLPVRWTLNIATFPATASLYLLSLLLGPVAAINVYILLGYVLSGVAMFLLVRRLLGHAGVAFLAGFAWAFYPFVVIKGQGHVDFVHGWVLVVPLWRLLELTERPTRRNGVWAGLALVLALAWTPYHILFAGVMAAALAVTALVVAWDRGILQPTATALAVAFAIGISWLGAMTLLNQAAPRSEVRSHTLGEADRYAARVDEYVVPSAQHPLLGDQAREFRESHLHDSNPAENVLYVGMGVLALALLGLVAGLREGGRWQLLSLAGAALVVAGFSFSLQPVVNLLGIDVNTPTRLLYEFTTTWRIFSRLVVVVMLGLVLLAAIGALWLVRRRAPATQAAVLALLLVVVAGDLWARQPVRTTKIDVPPTYERLARMPDGLTAEYPLVGAEGAFYGDIFYQAWHEKQVVNGYLPGSSEERRALNLAFPARRSTANDLKALGVRYVLVRRDVPFGGVRKSRRLGPPYRLVTEDPYIGLYEIDVRSPRALVHLDGGFSATQRGLAGIYNWLLDESGTIQLFGSCAPCKGFLVLTIESNGRPRDVEITTPDGTVVASHRQLHLGSVRLPITFNKRIDLRIEASPGPEQIPGPDSREGSIQVRDASFQFNDVTTRGER